MNPIDSLEAIFAEIEKIFVKLCETTSVLLSVTLQDSLFTNEGQILNQFPTFNNLDTEPNTEIENIISDQISEFNLFLSELITFKRNQLPPNQQSGSDCKILKVCSKLNSINALWISVQNVANTPEATSQNIAARIAEIKVFFDQDFAQIQLLSLSSEFPLINDMGNFVVQTIIKENYDTEENTAIEELLDQEIIDFNGFLRNYIEETRLTLPDDLRSGSDCEIIGVCDNTITINAIWDSFQNLVDSPAKISQLLAKAILDIKTLLNTSQENDPIVNFQSPIVWSDKGRLNIDPNSFNFILDNPNNETDIQEIQDNLNDVFGDLLRGLNKAVGNTSDPVT